MAAAVGQGDIVFDFASTCMDSEQQLDESLAFPAVIVEQVPGAHVLDYSGLSCGQTGSDGLNPVSMEIRMAGEQVVREEDVSISVEATCKEDSVETIEVAEALLHMDPPDPEDERHMPQLFVQAMGSPVTTVLYSHDGLHYPQSQGGTAKGMTQLPKKKKVAVRKPRRERPQSPPPDVIVKKRSKEGKGSTLYLWEFLMALLQDETTCPRYIKWTHQEKGIFKLVDSKAVSRLWGKHKNKPDMNYETMGRALRLVYQFTELAKNPSSFDFEDPSGDHTFDEKMSLENPSPPRTAPKPSSRGAEGVKQKKTKRTEAPNVAQPSADGGSTTRAARPLGLIQQQHLPIVSAEMLRTLPIIQSLQPGQHGSVFKTVQLLENLQNAQGKEAPIAGQQGEQAAPQSLRYSHGNSL
ncbi:hypothetical protein JZ751_027635 [Albula glossodonta]|uniref:ETS domain-containing protein n=1 Tax=Albula glossodonta TaxID=121402 RepID=A0A8T2PHU9_9TELE|nr:hypothetical protein JZ751_027635 [Albula glossodonta]